jgi:hypothetical protein
MEAQRLRRQGGGKAAAWRRGIVAARKQVRGVSAMYGYHFREELYVRHPSGPNPRSAPAPAPNLEKSKRTQEPRSAGPRKPNCSLES